MVCRECQIPIEPVRHHLIHREGRGADIRNLDVLLLSRQQYDLPGRGRLERGRTPEAARAEVRPRGDRRGPGLRHRPAAAHVRRAQARGCGLPRNHHPDRDAREPDQGALLRPTAGKRVGQGTVGLGNVISDSAPGFQPFGFEGGLREPHSGLTRFGTRDYDPTTGRWTTSDPLRFGARDPNFYAFVGADPNNASDPTSFRTPRQRASYAPSWGLVLVKPFKDRPLISEIAAQRLWGKGTATPRVVDVLEGTFAQQRAFIENLAKLKWALCTRCAAKSYSDGLALAKLSTNPRSSNRICAAVSAGPIVTSVVVPRRRSAPPWRRSGLPLCSTMR